MAGVRPWRPDGSHRSPLILAPMPKIVPMPTNTIRQISFLRVRKREIVSMAEAAAFVTNNQKSRFSDGVFSTSKSYREDPKPSKYCCSACVCPSCGQPLVHARMSIPSMFGGGVRRLLTALWMITAALFRCLRFAVAGILCVVGFVGDGCRAIGLWIAHPDDRRFLTKSGRHRRGLP